MSTIAAIATPCVPCAIGILRISGEDTCKVLGKVFSKPMAQREARRMIFGEFLDKTGAVIDSGLCVRFAAGSSYTGEEGAELYCHGSPVVMQALLESLFAAGAVQAKNGEFTQRAFLNGKMDIIQAEAVVDLIDAETAQMAQNAAAQLGGGLSRSVERIYGALMDIASRFYAVVDYPDEDIEDLARESIESTLRKSREELDALSATFERGNLMKNGIPAVILGRPNAGKSSLLNALLGYDRVIVTDIPGTTRDTVEERLVVGNRLLRLTDTAGIRATRDAVEKIGVDRAREAAGRAMVAILVLDGSAPLTPEDEEAIGLAEGVPNLVVALNKSDLPLAQDVEVLRKRFSCVIPLSAQTGEGVSTLCRAVADCFPEGLNTAGEVLTNARQKEAVSRARDAIDSARSSLERGMTPDVVLTDMEAALGALGELNGKSIREDLVQTIFSRFCVGK